MLVGAQFFVNFRMQLAFLAVILLNFDLVAYYSFPECLVFTVAWLLSDLAVVLHLRQSVAEHLKKDDEEDDEERADASALSYEKEETKSVWRWYWF